MTLIAVWCAEERLWMASDSRLSDGGGPLIDEGVKIFELPVVCRASTAPSGFFADVYFATSFGLGCAGHSLIYHQIHANLLPLLRNLIGIQGHVPSMADIAAFTAEVGTRYVQSLGHRRRDADQVRLLLAGWCPITETLAAYEMRPRVVDALMRFTVSQLDLSTPHFVGDHCDRARELHDGIAAADLPGASRDRAPLNVIRQLIEDTNMQSIGGDVQVGFTVGPTFQRAQTCRPIPGREPKAAYWLNAICTDDLPLIGPCTLGLMALISP